MTYTTSNPDYGITVQIEPEIPLDFLKAIQEWRDGTTTDFTEDAP